MPSWKIRELMTLRDVRTAADLTRKMHAVRDEGVPSTSQVARLVDSAPERIQLDTLDLICAALDVSPAELLAEDRVGVPTRVLSVMATYVAIAAAHFHTCGPYADPSDLHPGDPFGTVLAFLWRAGRKVMAVDLVSTYLAMMRGAGEEGSRLTWRDLRSGIQQSINAPIQLSNEAVAELCDYLEKEMPQFYGATLAELNTP